MMISFYTTHWAWSGSTPILQLVLHFDLNYTRQVSWLHLALLWLCGSVKVCPQTDRHESICRDAQNCVSSVMWCNKGVTLVADGGTCQETLMLISSSGLKRKWEIEEDISELHLTGPLTWFTHNTGALKYITMKQASDISVLQQTHTCSLKNVHLHNLAQLHTHTHTNRCVDLAHLVLIVARWLRCLSWL